MVKKIFVGLNYHTGLRPFWDELDVLIFTIGNRKVLTFLCADAIVLSIFGWTNFDDKLWSNLMTERRAAAALFKIKTLKKLLPGIFIRRP